METPILESMHTETERKHYYIPAVTPGAGWGYFALKRIFDFAVGLVGLAVLLLPMILVGIIIRLDSPGPALYRQERLGKNGKPFMLYKFRSMYLDAEKNGPQWADKHDDRRTRVGRFIRHTRIDELPQLWNIMLGHMSVVGPRPERECFYDEFEEYVHGFRNRLAVRPGLTGLAQVNGGYELLPEEKIVYDMEYISKMSVKMDIRCILMTVRLIFTHEGAR